MTEEKPRKKNVGRPAESDKIVWRLATKVSEHGGPDARHWTIEKESLN